jgi:hypothetical protein
LQQDGNRALEVKDDRKEHADITERNGQETEQLPVPDVVKIRDLYEFQAETSPDIKLNQIPLRANLIP